VVAVAAQGHEVLRVKLRASGMNWRDVMGFEVFGSPAGTARRLTANMLVSNTSPLARSRGSEDVFAEPAREDHACRPRAAWNACIAL
jgi:hypothetical protein